MDRNYTVADISGRYNYTDRAAMFEIFNIMAPAFAILIWISFGVPEMSLSAFVMIAFSIVLYAIMFTSSLPFWSLPRSAKPIVGWPIVVVAVWFLLDLDLQTAATAFSFVAGSSLLLTLIEIYPFYKRRETGRFPGYIVYPRNGWLGQLLRLDVRSRQRRQRKQQI